MSESRIWRGVSKGEAQEMVDGFLSQLDCAPRVSGDNTIICDRHREQIPYNTGRCPVSGKKLLEVGAMSESRKIVVPESRIKAVADKVWPAVQDRAVVRAICLAFADDLAQRPIAPTLPQMRAVETAAAHEPMHSMRWLSDVLEEWQRIAFHSALEPEIPPQIKDLLWDLQNTGWRETEKKHNKEVLEAFNRGRRLGENQG